MTTELESEEECEEGINSFRVSVKVLLSTGESSIAQSNMGQNLREFLLERGYPIYRGYFRQMNCKGMGICGSCRVGVRENGQLWMRRSCQIRCFQDMEIELQ